MAELNIVERVVDGILVLSFEGRATIGEGSVLFRQAVRRHLSQGAQKIVLDWSGVSYIDSSGIGEMVTSFTQAGKARCITVYAGITEKVRELLEIPKLLTVIAAYPSVEEAIKDIKDKTYDEFIAETYGPKKTS